MHRPFAILAIGLLLLAAPASGWGAGGADCCPPCCPQLADGPCETGEAPCASLATVSCCEAPPAAPASAAKRPVEAPSAQPATAAERSSVPSARSAAPLRAHADLASRTSPLRLSVVLLI